MMALAFGAVALWSVSSAALLAIMAVIYLRAWRRRRADIARGHAELAEFMAGAWEALEEREGL